MKLPARLPLARLPTPIQKLKKMSEATGREIYIWRDDLTGFNGSGNKIRKLEFLLADAIQKGANHIITCGGPQSNHTRATTTAARELGLGASVLILPKPGFDRGSPANANLLLNQIFGASISWIDYDEYQKLGATYEPFLTREFEKLKAQGKKPYVIPLGGSNALGCFGYLAGLEEMLKTWRATVPNCEAPDSIICALGSGGTFVGLQAGIEHEGIKTVLYGVNVIGPIETAKKYVTELHKSCMEYGISVHPERAQIIDGYVGQGYAQATTDDLLFYRDLATLEGILLDPCYTGKAFQGMLTELRKNPDRFGKRILFLHSGGGFGTFAYAEDYQRAFLESF
jgi:D-cysteine desulfhydrase